MVVDICRGPKQKGRHRGRVASNAPRGWPICPTRTYVEARDLAGQPNRTTRRNWLNQFVSVAQCVWLGDRTELPHRSRAPEGWQTSARMALGQGSWASEAESYHRSP